MISPFAGNWNGSYKKMLDDNLAVIFKLSYVILIHE